MNVAWKECSDKVQTATIKMLEILNISTALNDISASIFQVYRFLCMDYLIFGIYYIIVFQLFHAAHSCSSILKLIFVSVVLKYGDEN